MPFQRRFKVGQGVPGDGCHPVLLAKFFPDDALVLRVDGQAAPDDLVFYNAAEAKLKKPLMCQVLGAERLARPRHPNQCQ